MRTREQSIARYTWLRIGDFADAIGCSREHVRALIKQGEIANVIDVSKRGAKLPEYRIPQSELEKFLQSRRLAGKSHVA